MDYDQFDAAYGQVLVSARSLDAAALETEVTRLRALADTLDSPADQEAARLLVASLEDALARTQPHLSDEMAAAIRVQSQARTGEGTSEERIRRIRAGIDEIAAIADTADPTERGPILDLNEPLHLLLDSLNSTGPEHAAPDSDGAGSDGGR
jgi:hypothetical protein